MCPEGIRLRRELYRLCRVVNKAPRPAQQYVINQDQSSPEYKAAAQRLLEHNLSCKECGQEWDDTEGR